jgi:hypothetical protein
MTNQFPRGRDGLGDGLTYNENVLTLQTRNILVSALDTLGNLLLVLVAGESRVSIWCVIGKPSSEW